MDVVSFYQPDGTPADGPAGSQTQPVTTAAEMADEIVNSAYPAYLIPMYRNRAWDEGVLYSEAIAGARAMRAARMAVIDPEYDDPAQETELLHGVPWYFRAVIHRVYVTLDRS